MGKFWKKKGEMANYITTFKLNKIQKQYKNVMYVKSIAHSQKRKKGMLCPSFSAKVAF